MQKYTDDKTRIPEEEKEYCSVSKWCKDQLLVSKAILQKWKSKKN